MVQLVVINVYQNMSVLACTVAKETDEKFRYSKYGKKENWTNTETIRRRRLILNPTIQQVVTNLSTKYDYSSLHDCGEIFDKTFHHSKYENKIFVMLIYVHSDQLWSCRNGQLI